MKEAINVGYYRLNVQTGGDEQQVSRIVREFNAGFGAAVRSASDDTPEPAADSETSSAQE
jgi:hypothetical protein